MLLFYFCLFQVLTTVYGNIFGLPRLCFCRCGLVQNQNYPYQFPWLAIISTGSELVEGALISDQHVITAASSVYGVPYSNLTVTLGAYDRCGGKTSLNSTVESITINPSYSPTNLVGDLALIKLRYPVVFTSFISPICLPHWGLDESGRVGWTAAWQLNSENSTCIPRIATFSLLSTRTCLTNGVSSGLLTVDKGCFGPLGTASTVCDLDVGAPIMWRWSDFFPFRLVGIVSTAPSCEQNITPLYTRILDYLPWIHDNIRNDCNCI